MNERQWEIVTLWMTQQTELLTDIKLLLERIQSAQADRSQAIYVCEVDL